MKVGDKIKLYFHCAGTVSTQKRKISAFDDKTITTDVLIHPDRGGEELELFDRNTGKCLNDNTAFGSKRTIDPQHP